MALRPDGSKCARNKQFHLVDVGISSGIARERERVTADYVPSAETDDNTDATTIKHQPLCTLDWRSNACREESLLIEALFQSSLAVLTRADGEMSLVRIRLDCRQVLVRGLTFRRPNKLIRVDLLNHCSYRSLRDNRVPARNTKEACAWNRRVSCWIADGPAVPEAFVAKSSLSLLSLSQSAHRSTDGAKDRLLRMTSSVRSLVESRVL